MSKDETNAGKVRDAALLEPIAQLTNELRRLADEKGASPSLLYSMLDTFVVFAIRAVEEKNADAAQVFAMLTECHRKFSAFTKRTQYTSFEARVLSSMAPLTDEITAAQLCARVNCLRDSLDACLTRFRDRGLVHRDVRHHTGYFTLTAAGHQVAETFRAEAGKLSVGALIRTPILGAITRARSPTQPKR
jgi:hypothetical protein